MKFIPLASPDIQAQDIQEVVDVLKSGMLVQGKKVAELESNIATFVKSDYVIATSNGTSTMHLALVALGIGKGDEVIVPALSYVATANVVELVGATPVFVDVEIDSFNIDASKIEAAITDKTKAIIPVHEFGLPCDIVAIMKIANAHNLYVIEDAACALGASQNGQNVGTFGNFGSFSLHPRKAISSGEGGLITCQNPESAKKVQILRNHGVDIIDGKMEFVEAGFNYRMTDFQAALVNSQLDRLAATLTYKNELAEVYNSEIQNPKIKLPNCPSDRVHTWQTYHVLIDASINRDELIKTLREKGIGTNYGAQCIPDQIFYKNKYNHNSAVLFPNAFRAYKEGLAIPLYEKLTRADISYIAEELNKL
ncbi:MAG: aminotransferase class I/II-fold pyridoxal phosphate-dependent enzyme [Crocinitomix sp.]|nr:aminotransferase class I/II-fold pyridoxal phosphate-dependent enzyme [Crocinitomix sp.]